MTSILLNNCPDFLALTMNGSHKLVLDSASTLNLIASKGLLRNIHRVKTTMRVRCNAGVTTTNLMGWLGDYPNPVWYNPNGVANILSLFLVQRYYWVQYDNEIEDAFHVTMKDGTIIRFKLYRKGLYTYDGHIGKDNEPAWAFINTIADRKEEYTKREYRDAVPAEGVCFRNNSMCFRNIFGIRNFVAPLLLHCLCDSIGRAHMLIKVYFLGIS